MNKQTQATSEDRMAAAKHVLYNQYIKPFGRGLRVAGKVGAYSATSAIMAPTMLRSDLEKIKTGEIDYCDEENATMGRIMGGLFTAGISPLVPAMLFDMDLKYSAMAFAGFAATNVLSGAFEIGRAFKNKVDKRLEDQLTE